MRESSRHRFHVSQKTGGAIRFPSRFGNTGSPGWGRNGRSARKNWIIYGTEIERPLAVVMIGGLVTSTLFTLLALPTFYLLAHELQQRFAAPH